MALFLALFTYFAYAFVIVGYSVKIVKYLALPTHLRWELYPIMNEVVPAHGRSVGGFGGTARKSLARAVIFLSKDYLFLASYFKHEKSYWFFLYLSHIGFLLLMFLQALLVVGALMEVLLGPWAHGTEPWLAAAVYGLTPLAGLGAFVAAIVGNAGLFAKRVSDAGLRAYATPVMYGGYVFHILLSVAGLRAWYADQGFAQYRAFWAGIVGMDPVPVSVPVAAFIVLLNLHLIYLPFTRAIHYITRLFAFFLIRWDDAPNIPGGDLERRLHVLLGQKVTWSAPHIRPGKSWEEQVRDEVP